MENKKLHVGVNVEFINGRANISLDTTKGMTLISVQEVLTNALNLSIRAEKTPEKQARALKSIISHIENDFINIDSFSEIYNSLND